MKLPPGDDIDTIAIPGLLEELSSALRAGRLAGLLKGKGLTRSTIEELLLPESASRLKAMLTDHLSPEWGRGTGNGRLTSDEDDSEDGPADDSCRGGKVLVYPAKRTLRP
jgi:hypothetical protein